MIMTDPKPKDLYKKHCLLLARHFEYDSVITGSSMTVNFDTALFAEKLGLNTLKLSYDGAYPKDIDTILSLVQKSPNKVRAVFISIDILNYRAAPDVTAYEMPSYLYNDTVLDDIPYLLNKEDIYVVWKGHCISDLRGAVRLSPRPAGGCLRRGDCRQFRDLYPAPHRKYAELAAEKQVVETLLAYPNVKVYYFQDDFSYITNFDNYCDYTHYRHEMNDYMTECFAQDTCRLTLQNYNAVIDNMLSWAQSCDYPSYLP